MNGIDVIPHAESPQTTYRKILKAMGCGRVDAMSKAENDFAFQQMEMIYGEIAEADFKAVRKLAAHSLRTHNDLQRKKAAAMVAATAAQTSTD